MEFRKFYEATRNYAVVQGQNGSYQITGPYNKVWPVQINNGQLVLPPELEPAREEIITAYFNRPHMLAGLNSAGSSSSGSGSVNIKPDSTAADVSNMPSPALNKTFAFKPAGRQRI